ncbi:hypothetical protein Zmor_012781 [Zophobas morio]|uniref:Uncharacterized protein n=1 Tax=Zophobas morio TaxID=2755281 RepID=A0AA38IGP2_9CUCU|nr:hypothetical protein Zmor_012781 [Zophobas morio]
MRRLLVAACLLATICAYHIKKHDFEVVIDRVEYTKVSNKYNLPKIVVPQQELVPAIEILKKIAHDREINSLAGTEANLNDYADKIFANIQQFLIHSGYDPVELPDLEAGFNYTLIITYQGELQLTKGWLEDISTVHRGGDVIVTYSTEAKFLEVTVPIAFDDLQFTYEYSAEIMGLGPTGGIDGKIANIEVEVKIGFDVTNLVLSLDEFEIIDTNHIDVNFNGNPLVDWLVNLLTDVITSLLKPVILGIVENIIRGSVEDAIQSINDLIDGILNPTTPVPTSTAAAFFIK